MLFRSGLICDPSRLLQAVRAEVDRLQQLHTGFLAKAGVSLIPGWGSFQDPHTVSVKGNGVPERLIRADRILIAVGGRPTRPSIPGAELGMVSDDIFALEQLPRRVVVVGGGFIACEFAGILHGLGSDVIQLVRRERILRGFDEELADHLQDAMGDAGIDLYTNTSPTAIERLGSERIVHRGNHDPITCDAILLATGRRPFLEGLNLAAAGVECVGQRIAVDADQATNVPHIYAVGDVTDRVNLTPVAIDEGRAFADSVYGNKPRRVNHALVACAVFSQPELASVGLSESEAVRLHGADAVRVHRARFRPMAQALAKRGPAVLLKLVVDTASDRVLGCHMVGDHAAEIIQMAAIALGMGATKADFDRTMALHPTVAEEFVTMSG